MPLKYSITDRKTFAQATSEPREIAAVYFYRSLDCLVELAHRVAVDFFARPHLYIRIDANRDDKQALVPDLARLHARYGCDERIPSLEQRNAIYLPIFGPSDDACSGDFQRLRNELVEACAAYASRVFDEGVEMLRERVRTTHRPFKEFLVGLQGDSLRWSANEALAKVTDRFGYRILRSPGIIAVFGVSAQPRPEWPYAEDSNGDKAVEQISRVLAGPDGVGGMLTREAISNRQRTALRGAEAIATALDYDESKDPEDLTALITACYTWGAALRTQPRSGTARFTTSQNGHPGPSELADSGRTVLSSFDVK